MQEQEERVIRLRNGKLLLVSDDTIVVKESEVKNEQDYIFASRMIHGPRKDRTQHPYIYLSDTASSVEQEARVRTIVVERGIDEFSDDPTDLYIAPITADGIYQDPRVKYARVEPPQRRNW